MSDDIKPAFLNIARRLQAATRSNRGVAIVNMRFVVDELGNIVCWTTPSITTMEPKSQSDKIIELLSEGS